MHEYLQQNSSKKAIEPHINCYWPTSEYVLKWINFIQHEK